MGGEGGARAKWGWEATLGPAVRAMAACPHPNPPTRPTRRSTRATDTNVPSHRDRPTATAAPSAARAPAPSDAKTGAA